MRIAMWSGPRNLSTAMMYAFGARSDCAVVDEPLYAAYLAFSGQSHPMRDEILAAQNTDPNAVIRQLLGPIPDAMPIFYQKHMTQHMVANVDRSWMREAKNVFLIRHPARVIASYAAKRKAPTQDDIGFWQQAELFDQCDGPIVVESADIRVNPEKVLSALCNELGLEFEQAMLSWPAGGHKDDGVWAPHWYGAVHRSTGFSGPEEKLPDLGGVYAELLEQSLQYYEELRKFKI